MSEVLRIYALWLREVKRYMRDRTRLITSAVTPFLWLVIFGSGMGFATRVDGLDYKVFIFPGIVGQTLLFTSMWCGVTVVWDREFGFMKEILVAPISRFSIVLGKALGGSTDAMLQGSIVLMLSFMAGVTLNLPMVLYCLPTMFLISLGLTCIGLTIASMIESLESYGVIASCVNLPMFFLSAAIFPLDRIPDWLRSLSYLNLLTYGVDALRYAIIGRSMFPLYHNLLVLGVFLALIMALTSITFNLRR